jgi:hypothetical protein
MQEKLTITGGARLAVLSVGSVAATQVARQVPDLSSEMLNITTSNKVLLSTSTSSPINNPQILNFQWY